MFDKMIGKQKQLVFMNGLTAKSFDGMGKEQVDRYKEANEIIQKATLSGQKFALVRNVWRAQNQKGGWFTTNKKADDWYLEDGKLLQRQKSKGLPEKPKTYTGAKLDGNQKDFLMDAQGVRDNEIADLKNRRLNLLIGEEEYWNEYRKIIANYSNKISSFLTGKNAKERQIEGKERRRAVDAREQANKEVYDIDSRNLEENFKKKANTIERQNKRLENDDSLSAVQKLNNQIDLDTELLSETEKYYDELIKVTGAAAQPIIDLERKRDEEIGKIQDSRFDKIRSRVEAQIKDLELENSNASAKENISFEEQKRLIISNKKLSNDEKAYRISLLEIENQIKQNKLKIEELKALKTEYDLKVATAALEGKSSPEFENKSLDAANQIQGLETNNAELNNEAKNIVSEKTQAIRDAVAQGFKTLGFEQLADAYSATMIRLKNDTASWKDYAVLAASAVLESLSKLNEKQKERTISNLDDQLKYSQETAEQETGFINGRLEQLNALETLTEEQMTERAKLEDEAMVVKEQQRQREKMIETQKAKAEQKAAAQQALINGALAATMTLAQMGMIPGAIPAALALAFGIAQSIAIMSKDPTPKYWKGRKGGKAEWAWTQEKGAEAITDKDGKIKSLGSGGGAKMTWLDAGDKVYTAGETKDILKTMGPNSKIGNRLIKKSIQQSLHAPIVNVSVSQPSSDDSKKIELAVRRAIKDLGAPSTQKKKGLIIEHRPGYVSKVVGTYDITKEGEKWI
ncbi:MAG: hypothetical protein L0G05_00165 [Chryseobacterium sp.]|nr:hypothetical protein [Chryseobacterium sp.]